MTRDSESQFTSEAARESWLLWLAVIGFFGVVGVLAAFSVILAYRKDWYGSLLLLAVSLVLYLVLKAIVKIDSPEVVNLITYALDPASMRDLTEEVLFREGDSEYWIPRKEKIIPFLSRR
jgi:hypothetical protein